MAKQANKTLIGAFVVGAVALAVIAVFVLGGGRLFERKDKFVSYFEGSVKGLDVGAPVQLKGVSIGQVTEISLLFDPDDMSFLNRVVFESSPGQAPTIGDLKAGQAHKGQKKTLEDTEQGMAELINRGLRIKLEMQSIVTGKLLLAMDFYPESSVTLYGLEADLIEVPTVPTDLEKLTKTLEKLPMEDLFYDIKDTVSSIKQLVGSPALAEAIGSLNAALGDLQDVMADVKATTVPQVNAAFESIGGLARNLNAQVTPMTASITDAALESRHLVKNLNDEFGEVLQAARGALDQAAVTLKSVEELAEEDSFFQRDLGDTLTEVERAARAVRQLADTLDKNPEVLLRGKSVQGGR
jgi:paraquat-inducible protein B